MSSQVVTGCTKFLTVHSSTRTTNKNWADLDVINKLQSKFVRDNHCRNVHAFFTQVENEFGSVSWSTFDAYYETITRHKAFCRQFGFGLCDGDFFDHKTWSFLQAIRFWPLWRGFFDHKTWSFLQAIRFWPLWRGLSYVFAGPTGTARSLSQVFQE